MKPSPIECQDVATAAASGAAPAAAAAAGDDHLGEHLAVSVTRQVQISGPSEWKHLVTGIDSLDLGLYIDWGAKWEQLLRLLTEGKRQAEKTTGIRWQTPYGVDALILPSGKPPMYGFHVQTANFHAFFSRNQTPTKFPNLYVSMLAKALWLCGVKPAVALVAEFIDSLGGDIKRAQVSRCDLSADFHIPGGLTLDFCREMRVCRSTAETHHSDNGRLETYYAGALGSTLVCRIYDKGAEVVAGGEKLWFLDVWKRTDCKDVWRVEFQVRREVLKQCGISTLKDLARESGGLWAYLTGDWLSLRRKDNDNASRRTVHLWWSAVQEAGRAFGESIAIERHYAKGGKAPADWYVSHAAGCLTGYAARQGVKDFDSALALLTAEMRDYWAGRDFAERYRVERIKLGFDDSQEGGRPCA